MVFAVMVFAVAGVVMNVVVPPWAFLMCINDRYGDGLLGGLSSCAWLSRLVLRGFFFKDDFTKDYVLPPSCAWPSWLEMGGVPGDGSS